MLLWLSFSLVFFLMIAVNLKRVSVSLLLKPKVIFRLIFKGHFQAFLQWLTKNNFPRHKLLPLNYILTFTLKTLKILSIRKYGGNHLFCLPDVFLSLWFEVKAMYSKRFYSGILVSLSCNVSLHELDCWT